MTFEEKKEAMKSKRSNALNSKVKILEARIDAIDENNYNAKFLYGDGTNNGILYLTKLYYEEKNFLRGKTYSFPSLSNMNNSSTWNDRLENALNPNGDDSLADLGFYPDTGDGVAAEDMNLEVQWLNDNGEGSELAGIIGDANYFLDYVIGQDATETGPYTSSLTYSDPGEATDEAYDFLYGSDDPSTANVEDYNLSWTGAGVRGRRTRDVEVSVIGSDPYNYQIGNGTIDESTFFADTADSNGSTDGTKTEFLTELSNLIDAVDSSSSYQAKLDEIYTEVELIVNDNNELYTEAPMADDIYNDLSDITSLKTDLDTYVGTNTDAIGDDTLWGYYNWFDSADGTEGTFNTNLSNLESLTNSVLLAINTRYSNIPDKIGEVYPSDFTRLRKWRYFWIRSMIGKPTASLIAVNGMDSAINNADKQIDSANEELASLFGSTTEDRESYIPTPSMITAYENNQFYDNGVISQRRIGIAFIGQQHATKYNIYRRTLDTVSIDNTEWGDAIHDTQSEIDQNTNNVKMSYNDTDSELLAEQKYAYRIRSFDEANDAFTTASEESKIYDDTQEYSFSLISGSVIELGEHSIKPGQYIVIKNSISSDGFYLVLNANETKIGVHPSIASEDSGNVYPAPSVVFILTETPIGPGLNPPS